MKPYLLVEWNDSVTDAVGWMCVFNTVRGYADGGIRMHKNVSKDEVVRLATTMAWKHEACNIFHPVDVKQVSNMTTRLRMLRKFLRDSL